MDKKIRYKTVKAVWAAIDKGLTVYWVHEGYKVYVEECELNEYTKFSYRNGKCLSARYIETYFGSVLHPSELSALFSVWKESKRG